MMNFSGLPRGKKLGYLLFVSSVHAGLWLLSDCLLALFLTLFFAIREFKRIRRYSED